MSGARSIIVVDDDTDLREVLGELLADEGFETRLCANGRAALDLLRSGVRPHVILLDLMMPVVDGWQFRAEQLSDDRLRDIPVIVMTANRWFDGAPLAAEILQKPIGLSEILVAVERTLRAA